MTESHCGEGRGGFIRRITRCEVAVWAEDFGQQ